MQDDLLEVVAAQHLGDFLGDELVGGAVGAVAAHRVLLGGLGLEGVQGGLVGQLLEERGVEDGDVGDVGHELARHVDALEVGGVVQRSQRAQLFDQVADLVGDEGRAVEVAAALNDAVADGEDVGLGQGRALRVEETQDLTHADGVVGNRELFLGDGVAVLMLDEAGGVADALDDALGDGVAGFGVDELVLDGGGTGVNDENGGRGHAFAFRVGEVEERCTRPGPGQRQ